MADTIDLSVEGLAEFVKADHKFRQYVGFAGFRCLVLYLVKQEIQFAVLVS